MVVLRICALIVCAIVLVSGAARAAPDSAGARQAKADTGKKTSAVQKKSSSAKAEKAAATSSSSKKKSRRISMSSPGDPLVGKASWYGRDFHGGKTASGVLYDKLSYTAAHRTLPLGTVVEVITENEQRVIVCINNRGPFISGRVIDLSKAAAEDIGLDRKGVMPVRLNVLSDGDGRVTEIGKAFYVHLPRGGGGMARLGPFTQYADASVLRDVLRPKHPDVRVTLEAM